MDTSSSQLNPGEDSSSSSPSPPSPTERSNRYQARSNTNNDGRNHHAESSATSHISTTLNTARSASSPISTTTTSTVSTPSTAATSLTSTTTSSTNTSYSTPPSATTATAASASATATATTTRGIVNTPTRDMFITQNGIENHNNNHLISSHSHSNQAAVMMERVVFQVHYRICCFFSYWIPASVRVFLEYLLLVISILGFSALVLLHKSFVYTDPSNNNMAMTCFHDIMHQTILTPFNSTTTASAASTIDLLYIEIIKDDPNSVVDVDRTDYFKTKMTILQTTPKHLSADKIRMMASDDDEHQSCSTGLHSEHNLETCSYYRQEDNFDYQYAFSTTQAYLLLPQDHAWLQQPQALKHHRIQHRHHHHHSHNLTIVHIAVSSKDPNCFGEPFLQSLLWNCWIDLDILVQNWCLGMLSQLQQHERQQQRITSSTRDSIGYLWKSNQQGHLQELVVSAGDRFGGGGGTVSRSGSSRHRRSGYEQNTQHQHQNDKTLEEGQYTTIVRVISHWVMGKIGRWIQITCLFFFCTTLVSFTLTETQERMLWFTHELRRRVQSNLPVQTLVVGHLIQTFVFVPIMVGMIFFLMECYQGDKVLAFLQLSIVWCVEVFSVISLRSYQGMTFFPKIFFLLFCLFHVYHFANPYGFGYTALAVIGCFIVHSMFFFWNRFELPAVALELVTVDRPRRLVGGGATLSTTTIATITTSSASPASSTGFLSSTSPLFVAAERGREQHHWQQQQHTDPAAEDSDPITPPRMTGGTIVTTTMPTPLRNNSSRSSLPLVTNTSAIFRNQSPLRGQGPTGGGEPTLLFGSYASLSSSSQHTGSGSGVFRTGAGTDDDDEDSYVYFMEGEVVLRRNRPPRPGSTSNTTNTTTGHATTHPSAGGNISLEGTLSNNAHLNGNIFSRNNKPSNSSAIGLNVDDDEDDEATQCSKGDSTPPIHPMATNRNGVSSSTTATAAATTTPYSDESGGLQAILEVRLTPRHRQQANSARSNPNVTDPHSDGISMGTTNTNTTATSDSTDRSPPPPDFPILR